MHFPDALFVYYGYGALRQPQHLHLQYALLALDPVQV